MPKSIVIDATHLTEDFPTGVELYARELLPPLSAKLLTEGWSVTWVGHQPAAPYGTPAGVEWVFSPYTRFWSQLELSRLLRQRRPDLFFTPSGIPPLAYRGRTALTVHDMGLYVDSASYSLSQRLRLGPLMRLAVRRASLILVPSEFTRRQLQGIWRTDSSKVAVAYEAYEIPKVAAEPVPGINERPFLLFLGRIERKKNLATLIRGFAKLEGSDLRLVLAGREGYGAAALKEEVAKLPEAVRSRIIFTGYVSEGQKKWLYERALAVVVPCLFEGFGIPVLEAFAYRVPCLCSKSGALPEVAGNAAWYVQGDIATDWQLQITQLAGDKELRAKLVADGTHRLKDFSWKLAGEAAAEALIAHS